jgi:hypothetical protein
MKYNITKRLIEVWGRDKYISLPIHYKIYLRKNYKTTYLRRLKRGELNE